MWCRAGPKKHMGNSLKPVALFGAARPDYSHEKTSVVKLVSVCATHVAKNNTPSRASRLEEASNPKRSQSCLNKSSALSPSTFTRAT